VTGRPAGHDGGTTLASARFRPDIEGLRGIAVLMILAYHGRVGGFTGGYVGVDVFFVISGFLITRLIAAELVDTGTVALTAFYARRVRRLLPAALVVILITVFASLVLLPAVRVAGILGDASAAAMYVGNVRFAVQATDYLQAGLDPSPLLHYWSLGVEEQFYLFWPAFLVLAWRFRPGLATPERRIGRVVGVVALAAMTSFLVSVVLTGADAPLAFFLLPARIWELSAGALVALALDRSSHAPAPDTGPATVLRTLGTSFGAHLPRSWLPSALAAFFGLALMAVAVARFDDATPFPGSAAIVPVLGCVLVLVSGGSSAATPVHRVLATRPLRWVGRISYSLYLWHWPLLTLPAMALGLELPGIARLALVAVAFPIAGLSERYIERPVRSGRALRLSPGRTVAFAGAAGLVMVVGLAGVGAAAGARAPIGTAQEPLPVLVLPTADAPIATTTLPGASARATSAAATPAAATPAAATPAAETPRPATAPGPVPPDLIPSLADARTDLPAIYRDGCHVAAPGTTSGPCAYADVDSSVVVVLFGDSHAAQWFPAVEAIALERGWRLELLTKAACPVADLTVWSASLVRPYTECDRWRTTSLARITAERPALVIVSNTRYVDLVIDGRPAASLAQEATWDAALTRTLAALHQAAGQVVLLGDTPNPRGDPPSCLAQNPSNVLACATPASDAISPLRIAAERELSAAVGVAFIDPSPWVCPSEPCPATIGRYLVYRDGGHMTTAFATALAPYVVAALPAVP
jgi:peptidoglycan/LPS O-acetylase OafA/YrhL